jgi:hypothetical protein
MGRRRLVRGRHSSLIPGSVFGNKGEARGGLKENAGENSRDNLGKTKGARLFHRPEPGGYQKIIGRFNRQLAREFFNAGETILDVGCRAASIAGWSVSVFTSLLAWFDRRRTILQ